MTVRSSIGGVVLGLGAVVLSLAGAAEPRASANLLQNPSFEVVDAAGGVLGWSGKWWAAKCFGLSELGPAEFLSVDATRAHSGACSVRLRHPRQDAAGAAELLRIQSDFRAPLTPGVAYRLSGFWRSEGLAGELHAYFHTHRRIVAPKLKLGGTRDASGWQSFEGAFTPDTDEDWCDVNIGLRGRAGVLWLDDLRLARAAARIVRAIAPNAIHRTGVCLLTGNVEGEDLALVVGLRDPASGAVRAETHMPASERVVRFEAPAGVDRSECVLVVKLVAAGGEVLDSRTVRRLGRASLDF